MLYSERELQLARTVFGNKCLRKIFAPEKDEASEKKYDTENFAI
jgi:hypothetical protein